MGKRQKVERTKYRDDDRWAQGTVPFFKDEGKLKREERLRRKFEDRKRDKDE